MRVASTIRSTRFVRLTDSHPDPTQGLEARCCSDMRVCRGNGGAQSRTGDVTDVPENSFAMTSPSASVAPVV